MKKFFVIVALVLFLSSPAWAITVTPYDNADNLAQSLVGAGITISNVTYTGVANASGYFSGVQATLGTSFFDSGIILTSGNASYAANTSNTSDGITGDNNLGGDADLNSLIPGYSTQDKTILEFDFVSTGDAAYFNYFFASDEYNEYVNSQYNDVFGFFVEGPGVAKQNVALIPGTTTPVAINNVNNGANATLYNDNDLSNPGDPPYAFEYDGFTDVFTASILGLTAGEIYHLKIAIADAGDQILDSAVFLQAGSFSETPVEVPEPATLLLLGTGLLGLALSRRKK